MPIDFNRTEQEIAELEQRIETFEVQIQSARWRVDKAREAYERAVARGSQAGMRSEGERQDREEADYQSVRAKLAEAKSNLSKLSLTQAKALAASMTPEQKKELLDALGSDM